VLLNHFVLTLEVDITQNTDSKKDEEIAASKFQGIRIAQNKEKKKNKS
jgi:hypothetical protein